MSSLDLLRARSIAHHLERALEAHGRAEGFAFRRYLMTLPEDDERTSRERAEAFMREYPESRALRVRLLQEHRTAVQVLQTMEARPLNPAPQGTKS